MMIPEDTLSILSLWLIPGLGPRRIFKLVNSFQRINEIFSSTTTYLSNLIGVNGDTARRILSARKSDRFKRELERIERLGIRVMDFTETSYPILLREIYNAPPVLYVKGEMDFNVGIYISFVGSRKASFAGKNICAKLIRRLAEIDSSIVVVSGLALGIDSAAHSAALDSGLRTVAVMAGGLSTVYPAANRGLANRIASNGCLITEFSADSRPVKINFPLRNRIISGISRGTVIVEAGERSGASITASYTLEQNRELFALPGNADSKFSLGTNRLIQKGLAKLVLKAEDILEEISPNQRDFQLRIEDACPPISDSAISSDEERVMRILSEKKSHRDVIADELDISIAKIQAILTTLEIKGLVVSKPGAIFEIVE